MREVYRDENGGFVIFADYTKMQARYTAHILQGNYEIYHCESLLKCITEARKIVQEKRRIINTN